MGVLGGHLGFLNISFIIKNMALVPKEILAWKHFNKTKIKLESKPNHLHYKSILFTALPKFVAMKQTKFDLILISVKCKQDTKLSGLYC